MRVTCARRWRQLGLELAMVWVLAAGAPIGAPGQAPTAPAQTDSVAAPDSIRRAQFSRDSIERTRRDSVSRALQDSIARESALRRARREQLGAQGAYAGAIGFGVATLWALILLVASLTRGDVIEMETNWGGIGGGVGGWRMSRPLSRLLAVLALAAMFTGSVWMLLRETSGSEKASPPPASTPRDTTKTR